MRAVTPAARWPKMTLEWPRVALPPPCPLGQDSPSAMRLLEKFTFALSMSLGVVAVGAAGCTASVADQLRGFDSGAGNYGGGSSSGSGNASSSSGSDNGSSGGCSSCNAGDDATTGDDSGSGTSSSGATGDDGSAQSSSSSGVSGSSGTTSSSSGGIVFPPLSLPDGGLFGGGSSSGGTSSSGDGGVCKTKICIDPVFDCPLQGCFNGCTNFFCN